MKDYFNGKECPDVLSQIENIFISNEEYQKIQNMFNQSECSKLESLIDSLIESQKYIWDSVEIDRKFTEEDFKKGIK